MLPQKHNDDNDPESGPVVRLAISSRPKKTLIVAYNARQLSTNRQNQSAYIRVNLRLKGVELRVTSELLSLVRYALGQTSDGFPQKIPKSNP